MSWTPERVEQLRRLWSEGHSCSAIARQIGWVTRNAVIGKVSRLCLPKRDTTTRIKHNRRIGKHQLHEWHKKKPSKGKPFVFRDRVRPEFLSLPASPLPPASETDIARISFSDLEAHHCRFIALPEPAGPFVAQFCGETVVPGLSYCPAHTRRCFQPPRPRPPAFPMVATVVENEMEAA